MEAIDAIQKGDASRLGMLMNKAQKSFDEFAAPLSSELESPKLHEVISKPEIQQHLHGAKGVGSQGDGCAQLLVKSEESMNAVVAILEAQDYPCISMTIEACG